MFSWWGWLEFFKTDDGVKSMTRLLSFAAFFPASYVTVTAETDANKITAMGILLGAYVVQSGVNTIGAAMSKPGTVVKNIENAESLTKTGDVTVNKGKKK